MSLRLRIGLGLSAALDGLFPPECAACGARGAAPWCRLCAEACVPAPSLARPGLDAFRALYVYGGPVARAVRRLKYEDRPELAQALAPLLRARAPRPGGRPPDCVLPIPLAPSRLRTRGYNQALELARPWGPRLVPRALRRREVGAQVGLGGAARRANLREAFVVRAPSVVAGRHVLLVDDVSTTGATLAEAASALRRAGAASVAAVCLAVAEGER
jgi:ComF family protein